MQSDCRACKHGNIQRCMKMGATLPSWNSAFSYTPMNNDVRINKALEIRLVLRYLRSDFSRRRSLVRESTDEAFK